MPRTGDGVEIKQESFTGAPLIGRLSVASEREENKLVASWSSEGTFTTSHGSSDDHEGYEEQFAVPDVAPPGATADFEARRSSTGLKLERVEDQQPVPTRAKPVNRKSNKKKMPAPESEDERTSKTVSKDAGRQYTAEELEYALCRTELFRQLERNPVLSFIKPKLIGERTGPSHDPDLSKLTSMERVYDWDHESWMNAIHAMLDPLTVLVGTVKRKTTSTPARKAGSCFIHREELIPKTLEDAIVRLMQSTRMQTAPGTTPSPPRYVRPTPGSRRATTDTVPQESTDVPMESVSSRSSSRSKRGQDEDPDDPFDLNAGLSGPAAAVSTAKAGAGVARTPLSAIDLQPGERRGFWKHYAPDKWYKHAKIHGKLNNRKTVLLLDTGAEVSILDNTFAREIGCQIDTSVRQEYVGIRDETYFTVGKTRVKVTLAGNMVYYIDLWIDTADGTGCLPGEVRIQMIGRRPLYGSRIRPVTIPSLIPVAAGQVYDVPLRPEKGVPPLWMTRGATWVHFQIKAPVGRLPRAFGFVQPGSRKYDEWQNLAYGATSDVNDEAIFREAGGPMTERREYADPQANLGRSKKPGNPQGEHQGRKVAAVSTVSRKYNTEFADAVKTRDALSPKLEHGTRLGAEPEHGPHLKMGSTEEPDPSFKEIPEYEYAD
ncbi:Eukaryotic/viral aspartic protease [Phytophthora megakarya]|uniref:Eukaryotic/viral aspartic protease n=1 Tax=Phytophthora megakarya TaxID=4795 RepID=A0A225WN54_9STRA|nr:Eukaryotic/viral aspartic protease [Phytophthora megakarya]